MVLSAERQEFMDDPLASPTLKSSSEDFSRNTFAKAPVIELPLREGLVDEAENELDAEGLKAKAAAVVRNAKKSISRTYDSTKNRIGDAYSKVAETSSDLSQRAQRQARYMKEEQPLYLLGIIAGAAFAMGVALRVWRSSRYEQRS